MIFMKLRSSLWGQKNVISSLHVFYEIVGKSGAQNVIITNIHIDDYSIIVI